VVSGFSYMLTQLLIHVSKENSSRGEYTKSRVPGWDNSLGLSRALNRAGARTEAAAGCEKKTHQPGPLTGVGRGIEAGGHQFRGPVTNATYH